MRSAHAAACDAVSDAVAADYLGDVASYGRTLARLAVHAASLAPAHVLAMARTSEVWRRLDALNRRVFRSPLSRTYALPALCAGGLLVVLIGGFGVTRAGQDATRSGRDEELPGASGSAKPRLEPAAERSGIVELPDGTPAEGVEVALGTRRNRISLHAGRIDRRANVPRLTTGPDGRFSFAPPADDDRFHLVAVSDAGFADASSDELSKSGKLVLQAWGRIEGGVRIGAEWEPIRR